MGNSNIRQRNRAIAARSWSVIRSDLLTIEELSATFSKGHGLVGLYGLQQWEACASNYQPPLAPGYFYNQVKTFHAGLSNPTRKTAFKHLATQQCIACGTAVPLQGTQGDHLIASALGGPDSAQNSVILCRRCNSSKGTKDLLEWWVSKGYAAPSLARTALVLYCRVCWQHYGEQVLREPIHASMAAFLFERAALLPSDEHRLALMGATYALVSILRCVKEPPRHD